jgi:hypothetical protein
MLIAGDQLGAASAPEQMSLHRHVSRGIGDAERVLVDRIVHQAAVAGG